MSRLVRGTKSNDRYWIIADNTPMPSGARLIASGSRNACVAAMRLMRLPTREHIEAVKARKRALKAARKSGRVKP